MTKEVMAFNNSQLSYCSVLNHTDFKHSKKCSSFCRNEYHLTMVSRSSIKSSSAFFHQCSLPPFPLPPFCFSQWSHKSSHFISLPFFSDNQCLPLLQLRPNSGYHPCLTMNPQALWTIQPLNQRKMSTSLQFLDLPFTVAARTRGSLVLRRGSISRASASFVVGDVLT